MKEKKQLLALDSEIKSTTGWSWDEGLFVEDELIMGWSKNKKVWKITSYFA